MTEQEPNPRRPRRRSIAIAASVLLACVLVGIALFTFATWGGSGFLGARETQGERDAPLVDSTSRIASAASAPASAAKNGEDSRAEAGPASRAGEIVRRTETIVGRVVDREGAAIEGVAIELSRDLRVERHWRHQGEQPEDVVVSLAHTESAADGKFRFDAAPSAASITLTLKRPGFARAVRSKIQLVGGGTTEVEFVLQPESRLAGRVVDEAGHGIGGASVFLDVGSPQIRPIDFPDVGWTSPLSTTTGDDGRFEFAELPAEQVDLWVSAAGRAKAPPVEIKVALGLAATTEAAPIVLYRASRVAGHVRDPKGRGIPHVTLELDGAGLGEQQTDDTGAFAFDPVAPVNAYSLRASSPDFREAERADVRGGDEACDFALEQLPRVTIDVVDATDNSPVANASIRITEGSPFAGGRSHASADPKVPGRISFPYGEAATFRFVVAAAGFVSSKEEELETDGVSNYGPIVVSMHRGFVVRGRVLEKSNREPAPKIFVFPFRSDANGLPSELPGETNIFDYAMAATTNERGAFELTFQQAGRFMLSVFPASGSTSNGRAYSDPFDVPRGVGEAELVILISAGGSIAGVVRDVEGRPVPNVPVSLFVESGVATSEQTSSTGTFRFEGLMERPPVVVGIGGPRSIDWERIHAEEPSKIRPWRAVEVHEGKETRCDLTLVGSGMGEVSGRVAFGAEMPPFVHVEIQIDDEAYSEHTDETKPNVLTVDTRVYVGADGRFRFWPLWPGRYVVRLVQEGRGFFILGGKQVEVGEGAAVRVDFAIESAGLAGRVVAKDRGDPIAGAIVRVAAIHDGPNAETRFGRTTTDSNGGFDLPLVPAGAYKLDVQADGWAWQTRNVTAPSRELRVELTPAGSIVFETKCRVPFGIVRVSLRRADASEPERARLQIDDEPDGSRRIPRVPAGNYRIEFTAIREGVDVAHGGADVEVRAGETARVTATLE